MPDSDVAVAIYGALQNKCALVDDISIEQASKLFVDVIEVASKLNSEKAVVVVIDGLDETNRSRLRLTAGIFAELFAKLRCRNAKVFISSRTEDDIQKPFSKAFDVRHVKHIHLDTSTQASIQDVSFFLAKRIGEIVENNDLNWEEWPGIERMEVLCIRASGLFIWAATVVKFFQEQINALGRECLNDLLDAVSTDGMADIDALYGAILRIVYKGRKSAWEFETFRRVVGCIVVLQEPLCLTEIENLLDLRQNASRERVDIQHLVRRLRTVLVPGTDAINGQTIPRLHKSFFEFITSERAHRYFRINSNISNGELAVRCLRRLAGLMDKHTSLSENYSAKAMGSLPAGFGYAIQFGSWHLLEEKGVMVGMGIIGCTVKQPELQKLLRFSTDDLRCSRPLSVTLSSDRTQISTSRNNATYLWHRSTGQPVHGSILRHPKGVLSVAFSPDGKHIASGGQDKTVRIWAWQSGKSTGTPFVGHTDMVQAVAFSPDGKRIASGSADNTVRIWDSQSGKSIGTPIVGHTNTVWSVAFSPDGKCIASGSADKTVRIWDSQSGKSIGTPIVGHTNTVWSVAFSPDGKCIASGSGDKTVRIWDSQSGKSIGTPFVGHTDWVQAVAFSPDGKRIASGGDEKTVRIWDSQSGKSIGTPFVGHTDMVRAVAFSPDGKRIASGSADNTVRIWDSQSGKSIGTPFKDHTDRVWSIAFSPDGKCIASGSDDKTVRVCDSTSGQLIGPPFRSHGEVRSVALSPNGAYLICVSLDDSVRFWDLQTGVAMEVSLEGDAKDLISTTISPDGSRIAAASLNGTIYLWDATTRQLASPPIDSLIGGFKSLNFSSDSTQLILACIDGGTCLWNSTDGKPIRASPSSDSFLSGNKEVMSFNMKDGWRSGEFEDSLLRWLPSDDPNSGVWAYVDRKVIGGLGSGSVTIIDLNDIVPNRSRMKC
jgi:WD40 repeat protein